VGNFDGICRGIVGRSPCAGLRPLRKVLQGVSPVDNMHLKA
jgi:hypothetical protein